MTDQFIPLTPGTGYNVDTSELTVGSNTVERQRVNIADPVSAAAIAAVTARGVQGAYALATQNLFESGRNLTSFFTESYTLATKTETLLSLSGYKSGAAVAATTTPPVVSAGATYRVTNLALIYLSPGTTVYVTRFSLRANPSGLVAATSPVVQNWFGGGTSVTAGIAQTMSIDLDQGIEFPAGTGIGVSILGYTTTGGVTNQNAGYGMAFIKGYEY